MNSQGDVPPIWRGPLLVAVVMALGAFAVIAGMNGEWNVTFVDGVIVAFIVWRWVVPR